MYWLMQITTENGKKVPTNGIPCVYYERSYSGC